MATRTTRPGTEDPGEVATAAFANSLPGGWLGYNQVVATQALQDADSGGLETDLTGLSLTVTVNTSRRIRVAAFARFALDDPLGNPAVVGYIKEGATYLGRFAEWELNAASGLIFDRAVLSFQGAVILTPSAGSHTYKLTAWAFAGADMLLDASAAAPAHIVVEDIGPAS